MVNGGRHYLLLLLWQPSSYFESRRKLRQATTCMNEKKNVKLLNKTTLRNL